jgi:hypothetical protein
MQALRRSLIHLLRLLVEMVAKTAATFLISRSATQRLEMQSSGATSFDDY